MISIFALISTKYQSVGKKWLERHGPWYFLRCFLGCVCHDVTSILQGRLNARVVAGYELLLFLSERGIYERVLGFERAWSVYQYSVMAEEEPTEEPSEEPQVDDPEVEEVALRFDEMPADLVGVKKGAKKGAKKGRKAGTMELRDYSTITQ
eukprot:g30625.t1